MDLRRKLPHIDRPEGYQFVTIRTYDSLDDFLRRIAAQEIPNGEKQLQMDRHLDSSEKGSYFHGKVLEYFYDFLLSLDRRLYDLAAFCIMPNHLHILFRQKEPLAKIMKKLKGTSATEINRMLHRRGKFWASDYYDKMIRDEKHFATVYYYIRYNPIKAELKDAERRFYHIYE